MAVSSRIQFGVTTTETSVSGRFFRGFPRTRFIDPEAAGILVLKPGEETDLAENEIERLMGGLLRKRLEDCRGVATPQWCLQLLQHHLHMQMSASCLIPETDNTLEVHIDRHTHGIRIPGYEYVGKKRKSPQGVPPTEGVPYEVLIVCANRRGNADRAPRSPHRQRRQTATVSPGSAMRLSAKVKFHGSANGAPECEAPTSLQDSEEKEQEWERRKERYSEDVLMQYLPHLSIPGQAAPTAAILEPRNHRHPEDRERREDSASISSNSSRGSSTEPPNHRGLPNKEETWSWCDEEVMGTTGPSRHADCLSRRPGGFRGRGRSGRQQNLNYKQRTQTAAGRKKGKGGMPILAKLFEDEDEVKLGRWG